MVDVSWDLLFRQDQDDGRSQPGTGMEMKTPKVPARGSSWKKGHGSAAGHSLARAYCSGGTNLSVTCSTWSVGSAPHRLPWGGLFHVPHLLLPAGKTSACLLPQDNAVSLLPAVDHPVWLRKLYERPRRPPAAAGSVSLQMEAPPPSLVHLMREASARQALLGCAVAPTARVSMHKHTSLAFKAVLFPLAGVDGPKITFQMLQLVLVSPAL